MADGSKIEWTDATWNPITGCSVVSPGCTNCYAMKLAGTRMRHHPSREGLTQDSKAGPVWNGQVRFNKDWLHHPLQWKRPRMIFVCAHGDLYHEKVPDEWRTEIYANMLLAQQHTFQVLSKRSEEMWLYLGLKSRSQLPIDQLLQDVEAGGVELPDLWGKWPAPNIWHGVSVEDRDRLFRIDHLRQTPSAVRFLSLEPLLEDLGEIDLTGIHWVIVGGESGPNARPMHPDWVCSIRDQCVAAGVAFHFKQWGEWAPGTVILDAEGALDGRLPHHDWGDDRVSYRVGKKRAGRKLDGRTWDEMPT